MKRLFKIVLTAVLLIAVGLILLFTTADPAPIAGVRTELAQTPHPGEPPLHLQIWYPDRPVANGSGPLVIMSHGTGGNPIDHQDTANVLVKSGYVVVAIEHTGDNYRDTSHVGTGTHLAERPQHVSRTIDYMLDQWPQRAMIDPERIGLFGQSAGGFTALVVAGARPDLSRGTAYCQANPAAWTCRYVRKHGLKPEVLAGLNGIKWQADPRVKSAVLTAPAIGYSFDLASLAQVRIPLQIWAAEQDGVVDESPKAIRRALPEPPEFHMVKKAGHFSFTEPCNTQVRAIIAIMQMFGTEPVCDDPPGFDRVRFHVEFNRSVRDYFDRTLARSPYPEGSASRR